MGSTNALFTGLSGLLSNQRRLDVIGNNIANVNTTAFKSSRMLFSTLYSQTTSPGSGPQGMNGGTIAAVIDCHGVCTSIAEAYKTEGRDIGEGKKIWYATASLTVNYRKPTPIDGPITARARLTEKTSKKSLIRVDLLSHRGELTCDATVLSLRVPDRWTDPKGLFDNIK